MTAGQVVTGKSFAEYLAVEPLASQLPSSAPEGTAISLTAKVHDPFSGTGHHFTYTWTVTLSGDSYGTSGNAASYGFPLTNAGTYAVTLNVQELDASNNLLGSYSQTASLACTAIPPSNVSAGTGYTINEGSSLTLLASAYNPMGAANPLTYTWDINGDGVFGDAAGTNPTLTWVQLNGLGITRGPVSYQVSVRATTADGLSATSTPVTLTVVNLPPTNVTAIDDTFLPQQTFAAGSYPTSVAVGDFNGDGKPDLAVSSFNSNNSSVLLGNGDGTFQTQQTFATGDAPSSVAVGDFDGDGKADLAVTFSGSHSVSVLLGNGDGTFRAQQTFATGSVPSSAAVGDFNGDGWSDLVVANAGDDTVSVLLGNGNGTFQPQQTFATGDAPSSVTVGDFNGDGKADLAVANSFSNSVSVLLGNGDGSFQTQQTFATGAAPGSVAVGDFNADGKADIAVANRVPTRLRCFWATAMAPSRLSKPSRRAVGPSPSQWETTTATARPTWR